MSTLTKIQPNPLQALSSWDRLWQASDRSLPTLQRDCLAAYIDAFARPQDFRALSVGSQSKLVAGLPLVKQRRCRMPMFLLPNNPWLPCGDLLVDPDAANEKTFDDLAQQIRELPGKLLWLDGIEATDNWQHLVEALARKNCRIWHTPRQRVGLIRNPGDWDLFLASMSKSHRKAIRSSLRHLEKTGPVRFRRYRHVPDQQLEPLVRKAFEIEHRGWKGADGSSVFAVDGMIDLYLSIARALNQRGMLEIQFLDVGDASIAFEFGYLASGTYYSHKVSYDPQYSKFSPGNVLLFLQLESFFESNQVQCVDSMGILSQATARWCNDFKTLSRFVVATGGYQSNALVAALANARALVRKRRDPQGQEFLSLIK